MIWRYRYAVMKNVRIHKASLVVERLYVTEIEHRRNGTTAILKKEWKVVDFATTYPRHDGNRSCPPEKVRDLLRTAF